MATPVPITAACVPMGRPSARGSAARPERSVSTGMARAARHRARRPPAPDARVGRPRIAARGRSTPVDRSVMTVPIAALPAPRAGQCQCDAPRLTCPTSGASPTCCQTGQVCQDGTGACCTPTTCAAEGKNCGTIPNVCGGSTISCGSCPFASQPCTNNVCGTCVPDCAGKACGADNDCGGTCTACSPTCTTGSCPSDRVCQTNGTCAQVGTCQTPPWGDTCLCVVAAGSCGSCPYDFHPLTCLNVGSACTCE